MFKKYLLRLVTPLIDEVRNEVRENQQALDESFMVKLKEVRGNLEKILAELRSPSYTDAEVVLSGAKQFTEHERSYLQQLHEAGILYPMLDKVIFSICASTVSVRDTHDLSRRDGMIKGLELLKNHMKESQKKETYNPVTQEELPQ